jgi:hypothetical protein
MVAIPSISRSNVEAEFVYPDGTYPATGSLSFKVPQLLIDATDDLFVTISNVGDDLTGAAYFLSLISATDDTDWSPLSWKYDLTENFEYGRKYQVSVPTVASGSVTRIGNNADFTAVTFSQRTITGTYVDFSGTPIAGDVTFTLTGKYCSSNGKTLIVPKPITVTLDANGSFSVTLYATDTITNGFTYGVVESFAGGRSYNIKLVATGSNPVNIISLAPAYATPSATFSPIWQSHFTDADVSLTSLESDYATYGTSVPTQSSAITTNVAATNTYATSAYATIAPIVDERLMPFLLNGATNVIIL